MALGASPRFRLPPVATLIFRRDRCIASVTNPLPRLRSENQATRLLGLPATDFVLTVWRRSLCHGEAGPSGEVGVQRLRLHRVIRT